MSSNSAGSAEPILDKKKLPRHVAIIMDGNGRWARKRLLNRVNGHEQGSETVRNIVRACREFDVIVRKARANWKRRRRAEQHERWARAGQRAREGIARLRIRLLTVVLLASVVLLAVFHEPVQRALTNLFRHLMGG